MQSKERRVQKFRKSYNWEIKKIPNLKNHEIAKFRFQGNCTYQPHDNSKFRNQQIAGSAHHEISSVRHRRDQKSSKQDTAKLRERGIQKSRQTERRRPRWWTRRSKRTNRRRRRRKPRMWRKKWILEDSVPSTKEITNRGTRHNKKWIQKLKTNGLRQWSRTRKEVREQQKTIEKHYNKKTTHIRFAKRNNCANQWTKQEGWSSATRRQERREDTEDMRNRGY